ncbi:hypothetical protein [Nesterenkonia cremea]|uniref:Uncharacterized protein n=1 Tax=Nesterenkonia cremea TaxID=1882340 RepID=A0A917ARZ1_9MICC|nr:hypothetical protein [Nesterenkonia cremea]GGE69378.1 hypothetical protein GCM10011401_15910 [Nesterenkonia cremea]
MERLRQYALDGWQAFLDQLADADRSADLSTRYDELQEQYGPLTAERQ